MKKQTFALILAMCVCSICTFAQRTDLSHPLSIKGTLNKTYQAIPSGSEIELTGVCKISFGTNNEIVLVTKTDERSYIVPIKKLKDMTLTPTNTQSFWDLAFLANGMYQYYNKKGYFYAQRDELNNEADDYVKELINSHLLYEDEYIEDYIQSVFIKIAPRMVDPKRPGLSSIRILKSPGPDSYMLPNGTLIITTGLLATLESEEELTAILASEMAHYVLDHQVVNVHKQLVRAQRAEFWGSIVQGLAEGVDMSLSERYEYYVPGTVSDLTYIISAAVINGMNERMGMLYTDKQITQSDRIASDYLQMNNIDPKYLASALTKIWNYYHAQRDFYVLSKRGNYAQLWERLQLAGNETKEANHAYLKKVSGVITSNAIIQMMKKDYEAAAILAQKNIDNEVATDDDYIILAKANMGMYNTPEENERSMKLIQKAISMTNIPNVNAYKQEILLLLRMNKQGKGADALKTYINILDQIKQHATISEDINWAIGEINWADKLLQRVSIM